MEGAKRVGLGGEEGGVRAKTETVSERVRFTRARCSSAHFDAFLVSCVR